MQILPRSRVELLPIKLRASPMHTWLATGKAESDKEREDKREEKVVDKSSKMELTNTSMKQEAFTLEEE